MKEMLTEVYNLLCQLGVTANYTGFHQTAYAVWLCMEHPERLLRVTKWVYPAVAKQYDTNWKAVERNIRTVRCIIWLESRPLLEQLANRQLVQRPYTAQLLAILSSSLLSQMMVHRMGETATLIGENSNMGVADELA